jgi:hypothetical protein
MTDRAEQPDMAPVVAALKKSGFPLQTRIEHEINARAGRGWRLLASEYPWRSDDGDEFIDVIANCGTVVLVIECKKAQERSLLFLRPLGRENTGKVRSCMVWHFEPSPGSGSFGSSEIKKLDLEPESYQAAFCVTTTERSSRLLEQDARPVVLATDALVDTIPSFPHVYRLGRSFFLPAIVTTAPLYTLRYEPTDVPLETGSFENLDLKEIEPIQWIRFHKTLTAHQGSVARTVFVVNSTALPEFLDAIAGTLSARYRHLG